MDKKFDNLEPQSVWNYFYEITRIPRPSKKEEKIIKYLIDFAKKIPTLNLISTKIRSRLMLMASG
jgi:di/tripeptidase